MREQAGGELIYRKLIWITFFRLVMVTVLLGGTAFATWKAGGPDEETRFGSTYALIAATYVVSLAFAVFLRYRRGGLPPPLGGERARRAPPPPAVGAPRGRGGGG